MSKKCIYYFADPTTGEFTLKTTTDSHPNAKNPFRQNSFYIDFYATKTTNGVTARSLYRPDIFVCACDKPEQCDESYKYYFEDGEKMGRQDMYRPSTIDNYYLLPCKCPASTSTEFCQKPVDICASYDPCSEFATCTNDETAAEGYTCQCDQGFAGNGKICIVDGNYYFHLRFIFNSPFFLIPHS